MIKRILKIVLGIVLILVALFPAVYMNTIYGYFPVLFLILTVLVSFLCMWRIRKKVSISSDFLDGECERGKSVSVGLDITNGSWIMCPKAAANVFISDIFQEEDALNRVYFTLAPKAKADFCFDMDMSHVGIYRVGIRDMEIYDFYNFFHQNVPVRGEYQVCVKPRIRTLEELSENEIVMEESSQDTRTTVLNGTDYVGVREYAMGDSMKQIHWKLSAHSMGYMTKLQESSRQMDFSVVLDFAAIDEQDHEVLMDIQDALIETSLSLIDIIAKQHTAYSLIYCNKERQITRTTPKGREDDLNLLRDFSVITPEPDISYPDACHILEEEGSRANRSTNVLVCTSRVTDALLQELMRIKRQRRNPELWQIVPASYNSRQMETLRARLRGLDEAGIHHCFVYTTDAGGNDR